MWKLMGAVLAGVMVECVSAADLSPDQNIAVQAYLAEANKEASANGEGVELISAQSADLNGDGKAEIILNALWAGGTWWNNRVVVFTDKGKGYQAVAQSTEPLGQVESVEVKDGFIHVHALWEGPNDPRCCPTMKKTTVYQWQGNKIVAAGKPASTTPATSSAPLPAGISNVKWEYKQVRGIKMAGVQYPVVGISAINLFCQDNQPVFAATFSGTTSRLNPVHLDIQIGDMVYPIVMKKQAGRQDIRMVNLRNSRLPKGLLSGEAYGEVTINGKNHGLLSLTNAGQASREALQDCYRY
jgi:hypothetical protein